MYYFINDENQVLENMEFGDPQKEAQALANYYQCTINVIRGEHIGIEVSPTKHREDQRLRAEGAPTPGMEE